MQSSAIHLIRKRASSTSDEVDPQRVDALFHAMRLIAREVAARYANDVDAHARFPEETILALKEAHLLSALIPVELGGAGLGMHQLGQLVSILAEACASSAMVLAMHYSQVACLVRHGFADPEVAEFVRRLPNSQELIASMTSEVGTAGDTRSSICAVRRDGARFVLSKEATTGSYCNEADAILVTARRDDDAAQNDQVLVMVRREQRQLTQTTTWDTLGMRGTRSPGFQLHCSGPVGQVLSAPFGDIAAMSMVPYSHILWCALWTGIAASAYGKAAEFVRRQARQSPSGVPLAAGRLVALNIEFTGMRRHWETAAKDFDDIVAAGEDASELTSMRWALRLNHLKVNCSDAVARIVHGALQVIGVAAYKNDSPVSLGREYRDALSASLMISNDRINAASAAILLVTKE